jgi:hypothetical protein
MRKLAFLYLVPAVCLGCSLETPQMPSWNLEINLPVLTESYSFRDLADDHEAVSVVNDSILVEVNRALGPLEFAGSFNLNPCLREFGARIGAFEIGTIPPSSAVFTIGEVWAGASALSGNASIPPFCFPLPEGPYPSKVIDLGGDFVWAEVESGRLGLTVANHLEVDMGDPLRGCPFVIMVDWSGGEWDSISFEQPIPAGGTAEIEMDLAGLIICNTPVITVKGGSPGSAGEVYFSPGQEIEICAAPEGLLVQRALACLPGQSWSRTRSVIIPDSTRVILAGIDSGDLTLGFMNNLPADVSVEISTENLTYEGTPFVYSTTVPGLSYRDDEVSLAGYVLSTDAVGEDPWYGSNTVFFEIRAETEGTRYAVETRSTDSIAVSVGLSDIVLNSVTGTLKPVDIEISEEHSLNLPEICGALDLSRATLAFCMRNDAMVGGWFDVEVTGERGSLVETAALSGEIIPADLSGTPSEVVYEYNTYEIRDLISIMPDIMRIDGEAVVWGCGRVYTSDALRGDLTITLPLVFEAEGDTVRLEPRDFEIPQEVRDEIERGALEASFRGEVVTDVGLCGAFNLFLGADSADTYETPLLSMSKPEGFAPFGGPGFHGGDFEIVLTRENLEIFQRESMWVGLEVLLDSTEAPVAAGPDNFVKLKGWLRFLTEVD